MLRKILITSIIIYIPNSLHFPTSLGLPGLNVYNLLFLCLLILYFSKNKTDSTKPPLLGPLKFYYLTAFVAFFVSIPSTTHIGSNLTILKDIVFYSSLYFLIYGLVDDIDELKYYMKVVYFVVFLMCVEIMREKMSYGFGSSHRVAGAFGHDESAANYAGVFLAIFLPIFLKNFLYKSKEFTLPIFSLGMFLLGIFAIFYTYSRQAYASILATSTIALAKKNKILLGVLAVLIINSALWIPDSVMKRIDQTQVEDTDGEQQLDESTESRFVIWENAYDNLILNNFALGIGLNEFKDRIDPFMPDWIKARDAHNSFVLILTERGIVGLLSFLILLLAMYKSGSMIKNKSNTEYVVMLGEGYQLVVIAVILGNVYSSTFNSPEVMGNFWILSALIHKIYYIDSKNNLA